MSEFGLYFEIYKSWHIEKLKYECKSYFLFEERVNERWLKEKWNFSISKAENKEPAVGAKNPKDSWRSPEL